MTQARRAEIAGGGFAGLAAACALAQRGWRVRVHERGTELRTAGAGGLNSRIRDSLALLARRKAMPDGAIRVLLTKTEAERAAGDTGTTIEYWSGSRRILYTPCSDDEIYVALTMLDKDAAAKATP